MKLINTISVTFALITLVLSLSACSTSKEEMFPHSDNTMQDIYNQKTSSGVKQLLDDRQTLRRENDELTQTMETVTHTRSAQTEINGLFRRLDNPDLVMYIFPHLTADGKLPVPGYSTLFSFYGEVQYAMPGEQVEILEWNY